MKLPTLLLLLAPTFLFASPMPPRAHSTTDIVQAINNRDPGPWSKYHDNAEADTPNSDDVTRDTPMASRDPGPWSRYHDDTDTDATSEYHDNENGKEQ